MCVSLLIPAVCVLVAAHFVLREFCEREVDELKLVKRLWLTAITVTLMMLAITVLEI